MGVQPRFGHHNKEKLLARVKEGVSGVERAASRLKRAVRSVSLNTCEARVATSGAREPSPSTPPVTVWHRGQALRVGQKIARPATCLLLTMLSEPNQKVCPALRGRLDDAAVADTARSFRDSRLPQAELASTVVAICARSPPRSTPAATSASINLRASNFKFSIRFVSRLAPSQVASSSPHPTPPVFISAHATDIATAICFRRSLPLSPQRNHSSPPPRTGASGTNYFVLRGLRATLSPGPPPPTRGRQNGATPDPATWQNGQPYRQSFGKQIRCEPDKDDNHHWLVSQDAFRCTVRLTPTALLHTSNMRSSVQFGDGTSTCPKAWIPLPLHKKCTSVHHLLQLLHCEAPDCLARRLRLEDTWLLIQQAAATLGRIRKSNGNNGNCSSNKIRTR